MNILITTNSLDYGGVEEVLLTYARFLSKKDFKVYVACLNPGRIALEMESLLNVQVIHIRTRSRFLRFLQFLRIMIVVRPQIVHNHACWYGLIVGRLVGAKCVETIHNEYSWFNYFEKMLYGIYSLFAHRVIAVSQHVLNYSFRNIPFMRKNRSVVIYNGINISRFGIESQRSDVLREFSIPESSFLIGFVGRLEAQKGISYLLKAAHILKTKYDHLHFLIIGDGSLRNQLEKESHELVLCNVHFVGFKRDIPRYIRSFDLYVLPSLFEGHPLGVLEAFAASCPVVATRVSGTPEIISDHENGVLVDPANPELLSKSISYLIDNQEVRKKIARSGYETVRTRFTEELMVNKTIKLYHELLSWQ